MARLKTLYRCQKCGYGAPKGFGQCPDCSAWNSMIEEVVEVVAEKALAAAGPSRMLTELSSEVVTLDNVKVASEARTPSAIGELDRLLGGGLVAGQVVLLAGPPGIGKSTLMMQAASALAHGRKVLYISGEESLKQVSGRAQRLGIKNDAIYLLCETNLAKILQTVDEVKPWAVVLDSVQTVYHPQLSASPGSISQVRECAAELLRIAKSRETVVFILGHITKEGALAGPKVLEHMVDTVLYFDTERHDLLRVLRAQKNRFGPTDEIGLFEMAEKGLKEVDNASSFFVDSGQKGLAGRAVSVTMEGTRPLLVEAQALVVSTRYPLPRRMATGLDLNRVHVLLAAMEKHLHLSIEDRDVFVSLAGGLRLKDPAVDLAACMAVLSSAKEVAVPEAALVGEVGLLGEVSRVPHLETRLKEAAKAGFKRALVAARAAKDLSVPGLKIEGVSNLQEAAGLLFKP
jgi:DNA repair protein RadA/Sms